MRLASKLMGESQAGNLAAVTSILSTEAVRAMSTRDKANFLGVGLFEAAAEGHLEIAKLLADAGADLNRPHAASGESALTISAFSAHDAIVTLLLVSGANANVRNKEGITPLMIAAGRCSTVTVKLLLELGADPDATAKGGITARTCAEMEGRHDVLRLLEGV